MRDMYFGYLVLFFFDLSFMERRRLIFGEWRRWLTESGFGGVGGVWATLIAETVKRMIEVLDLRDRRRRF